MKRQIHLDIVLNNLKHDLLNPITIVGGLAMIGWTTACVGKCYIIYLSLTPHELFFWRVFWRVSLHLPIF